MGFVANIFLALQSCFQVSYAHIIHDIMALTFFVLILVHILCSNILDVMFRYKLRSEHVADIATRLQKIVPVWLLVLRHFIAFAMFVIACIGMYTFFVQLIGNWWWICTGNQNQME